MTSANKPTGLRASSGYFLALFAIGMTTAALGPALPYLAGQTQSLLSAISLLFTARSLGYLVGSLQGGRLYDRTKGHPVMAVALLTMAAMAMLVPWVAQLWLLAIIFFVLGTGEGSVDVGANTLLVWVHGRAVGPYMNALHFFFGLGALVSPLVVAQVLLASGGITWAFALFALLLLPIAAWIYRQPSPAAQEAANDVRGAPRGKSKQVGGAGLLVFLFALFFFLHVGAEIGFGGWIFTYALEVGSVSAASAGYLTSAFWGSLTFGRLLSIPLANRFSPKRLLWADLLGCLVSIAIVVSFPDSLPAIWVGTLGLGFSIASIFPLTISFAERRMTITGGVTGWFLVGASAGGMTLPWLMGQLFQNVSPSAAMFVIAGALFSATCVFATLVLYSRRYTVRSAARGAG